jgi:hypothetical protein
MMQTMMGAMMQDGKMMENMMQMMHRRDECWLYAI